METTKGSVTVINELGDSDTRILTTNTAEELEQNRINKENAKLIDGFAYLVIPREILLKGFSGNDALILAHIHSFLGSEKQRYYYSNEKLAKIFNLSVQGVSKIIKKLAKSGEISVSYRRMSNGGLMRFVNIPTYTNYKTLLKQSLRPPLNKVVGIDNSIIDNKIIDNNTNKSNLQSSDCGINSILDIFYEYNNSLNYANTTYRKAVKWLIEKYGIAAVEGMARKALSIQGKQFAPTVINPLQLKDKVVQLKRYFDQKKDNLRTL
jgi:DNA-binding Lrp family transcriptional regulator